MAPNPILDLLEYEGPPPQRIFQHARTALAQNPQYLSDLTRRHLRDDFLGLVTLTQKANHFSELLKTLDSAPTKGKDIYSRDITAFVEQLAEPLSKILSQVEFHGLVGAALPLCRTNPHRWRLLKSMEACDQALVVLSTSNEGHAILLGWVQALNKDGAYPATLEAWTRSLVLLVENCPYPHEVSVTLARWKKSEILKSALRGAIEDDGGSSTTLGQRHDSSPGIEGPKFVDNVSCLFPDLGLPLPESARVCNNNLDLLSCEMTLSILEDILKSYPCPLCSRLGEHGFTLPDMPMALVENGYGSHTPEELFDTARNGIGDWRVVLSSRAYHDLRHFKSDTKIWRTLERIILELASGNAESKPVKVGNAQLKIPLWCIKCSSDTVFLWQVDIAFGPKADMEQQVVKVWSVGPWKKISSMINEIAAYQRSLSDTVITKCLERGRAPKRWDRQGNNSISKTITDLDIRLVDQAFIDTFNKSFTVTKPLLRSIVQQDLTAEFFFDLSPTEMEIIQHYTTPTLILGRSGTGKTTCLLFKMVWKYVTSSKEQPAKQILLTRSDTLAEKLRTYSRKLVSTLSQKRIQAKRETTDQRTLFELDHHEFPLVCTYEQFLRLIDNTVRTLYPGESEGYSVESQRKLVDFKIFRNRYWQHLPHGLVKRLSPQLVYSEIMGVIKGSVQTCSNLRSLELQHYQGLSTRIAPNVTSDLDRAKIFQIYEKYEELKRADGYFDTVDWVTHLLGQVRKHPYLKSVLASYIDELYVDEVQDQHCVDIALMLELVYDPRGLHFGGDTAQAISQDSAFRFEDVKSLFYRHYSRQSAQLGVENLAKPHLFTLNRNYRSHQGILSMASSVMELLWKTFPDTVDKLDPEIGTLVGPVPILFLKCDASILMRSDTEDSNSPEYELLFGAEQVILTRDDIVKAELAEKMGERALVLTILQAKGMEFDDVILWDFLTTSPDAGGWRSLQASTQDTSAVFDTTRHAALCSELKHLYVAVTRARVRFLMIESSNDAARPFIRLMADGLASPLLEITSVGAHDFHDKVKALQPRKCDDPRRWRAIGDELMSQSSYKDACVCFRRAEEPLKVKEAEAYLHEVDGEMLDAQGKTADSRAGFERAATDFKDLKLIQDAVRVLVRLERRDDAAELLCDHGNFRQAALLFEETLDYKRASEAWHSAGKYDMAFTCLRKGSLYDQMVLYMAEKKDWLTDNNVLPHPGFIKILLKQKKISQDLYQIAIPLIGSPADQENFYLEFEMNENLLELYTQQQASLKLYDLLIKLNRLEDALQLAASASNHEDAFPGEGRLSKLVPIVVTDRINSSSFDLPQYPTEGEVYRAWKFAYNILRNWDPLVSQHQILSMDNDSVVKVFLCLYVMTHIGKSIVPRSFDEVPFELLHYTVKLIKSQKSDPQGPVGEAVLLLCGVFAGFNSPSHFTLRAWSPLRTDKKAKQDRHSLPKAAIQWVFHEVGESVIRIHEFSRAAFTKKWPRRCHFFLVTGTCGSRDQANGCTHTHEHVAATSCKSMLENLMQIANVLCEATTLYYRRTMSDDASKNFLGARRYWIERLLRGLAFVSAFEQDTLMLRGVARSIGTEESLRAVASCLEENVLFKARDEWTSAANIGYVLEQLQFAAQFSQNFKHLLIRKTRGLLRNRHESTYEAMIMLEILQAQLQCGNSSEYHRVLKTFFSHEEGIMGLPLQHFLEFHCHTANFESLALCLLLRLSQSSMLVPRSWLDLHMDSLLSFNSFSITPSLDQRTTDAETLVLLVKTFVELLKWLDKNLPPGQGFIVCGREYHIRLLQQRNAELLAIILVNFPSIPRPRDFYDYWQAALGAFKLPSVKAKHLDHRVGDIADLRNKLIASHSRYHGKNPLLVLHVTDVQSYPFSEFQKSHKLESVSLRVLRSRSDLDNSLRDTMAVDDHRTSLEQNAALCIQRHWRKFAPRIRVRNEFAATERGRMVKTVRGLANGRSFKIRFVLFQIGVDALLALNQLDSKVVDLQALVSPALDIIDPEEFEAFDIVLEAVRKLEAGLESHRERLSDTVLEALVRAEDAKGLKELLQRELNRMGSDVAKVAEVQGTLDGMSKGK